MNCSLVYFALQYVLLFDEVSIFEENKHIISTSVFKFYTKYNYIGPFCLTKKA